MASAMSNTNYSLAGYSNNNAGDAFYAGGGMALGTSQFITKSTTTYETVAYSNAYIDSKYLYAQVFGDLA